MKTRQKFYGSPGRLFLLATVGLLALFSFDCIEKFQSPVAPNWDTQLSVPLLDSTYHLSEAMSTNPGIIVVDGGYVYQPDRFQFDPIPFGKDLQLYPQFGAQQVRQQIGNVVVPLPSPVTVNVAPGSLVGQPLPSGPVTQPPIPATSFPSQGLPPLLNIDSVHFATGTMGLTIHNALPIPIEFPSGFALKNSIGGAIVATFPATTINPHETWIPTQSILNQVDMLSQMEFSAQFQSAGSGSSSVTYSPDSGVTVSYTFNNFTVSSVSGTSFTPFERTATTAPYIVDSLTLVKEVSFNGGKLQVRVQSNLNAAATVNVTIGQLRNSATNQPFSFDARLDGFTAFDSVLDMREWKIKSSDGSLTNSLDFNVTLKSDPLSSGSRVIIHSTDYIQGELLATEVPFPIHELAGVTRTLPIDIDQDVDVPLGTFSSAFSADSVLADSITIRLHIGQPGHPVDLNLALAGRDEYGNVVATLPPFVQRVQPSADAVYEFPHDAMAHFLSGFVSRHGTLISVIGTATINPEDVYNTIPHQIADLQDTSNLYLGLEVVFPMRAGVINGKIIDKVPVSGTSSTGANVDKDLLTSVKKAGVYLIVDNAIPVGVSLSLDFLNSAGDTILTLPRPGQPAIVVAAGTVASPTHTPQPLALVIDTDDAQKFGDAVDVIVSVGLNTGQTIARFTPQDYVHVRAYSNMVFNINPDKLKNK